MADTVVAQFVEITGASPEIAAQYLQLADSNIESAMQLYFENGGNPIQPTAASSTPQSSTRPGRSTGYQDDDGVIHIDSDDENNGGVPVGQEGAAQAAGDTFDADLEMARRLQQEFYTGGDPTDNVRAPIERRTETLVGPDLDDGFQPDIMEHLHSRAARRAGRPGIFNQRDVDRSIWNEDGDASSSDILARATGGASEASSKANMLAEMYRPPFEIMSRLPWDLARDEGREKMKWLLVNIQDSSIFDCQLLNRDLWKNDGVKETIRAHFLFMQYSKDDPRGAQYIQYYFPGHDVADNYPHIAIVDPRTGEQVKTWSGPPVVKAPDFLMQLHEFLDRYSLDHNVRNPVAKRKPEVTPQSKIDTMTEEEMLDMALKNSLVGPEPTKAEDPDDLTRSIGDIKGKGKAADTGETDDADMSNGQEDEEPSPSDSPFFKIPSDKPHTEPAADPATTTRIQFRHSSGRVIRRFALADPVQRLYEWLKASPLEDKHGVEFELVSMGQNLISLLDKTIEEAGLKNGTVMVGFIED
ncbi:UBX domain-containing protein 2 [Trichophyton interdigitale]|uniref:UBX domain-containing protein 2 n=1 Tax=Trichophyton interdigitale TaxID=101480 RepID=A0A9P4YLH9_9EURO|nr:UBX domain-containing protein 2 [Trichophyton interdigitale]KAF3900741.1 UBX domain-containing protein 2 [Trichophyton interdigitale]KAG8211605.1 UBX domain-containing protein 2 [Trichophyton interdigitale]